ncbi:MAG: GGDEF domain-containing protein [Phycisphaerales bacterium]|nr:GGDEF domain-containing protein [Phycisphaerales bacterium]
MSATQPRKRRRRILTIGPVADINDPASITTEAVASLFDALGLIATCPARKPIEAVLIAAESPHALHEVVRSAEAIRRIDPTIQVILVAEHALGSPIASQVDQCLEPPLDGPSLERALDGVPHIPLTTPSIEPAQTESIPTHAIGDAELLEAVLQDTGQLIALAVQAIEQRTNIKGITFIAGGAGGPDATPVRRGLATWGCLEGGPVETLEVWAGWLAKWIALAEMVNSLQQEANRDFLTGTWNRRCFEQYTASAITDARNLRQELTLFVFDIDGFKQFNDRFGHEAGDTILIAMVRLLGSVIREGDRVARLGGDEFAVLFSDFSGPRTPGSRHPDSVEVLAHRFQNQINDLRFPELGLAAPGRLSISGGLATFPWDGDDTASLLRIADQRAIESKRRGKNCLTFGPDDVD